MSPAFVFTPLHRRAADFRRGSSWGEGWGGKGGGEDSSSGSVPLLNAGLVEVNFHRQRPRLLALFRLLDGHGDRGAQGVRVHLVDVIQELFVPVDAQLQRDKETTVVPPRRFTHHVEVNLKRPCAPFQVGT